MSKRRRFRFQMPDERRPLRWFVEEMAWAIFWLGLAAFGARVIVEGL